MADFIDSAITSTNLLLKAGEQSGKADATKGKGLAGLLDVIKAAELEGTNIHALKRGVYAHNGWAYKEWNVVTETIMQIDGEKAPPEVAVYYSQAKKAFTKFESFQSFATWEEMVKRSKDIDPIHDLKGLQKSINKTVKALKTEDWKDYAQGALENLKTKLEQALAAKKAS